MSLQSVLHIKSALSSLTAVTIGGMGGTQNLLGYTGNDINREYMVTIKKDVQAATGDQGATNTIIRAPLQENIVLKFNSNWAPIVPTYGKIIGQTIAGLFGKSLNSKYMSRRIWMGTDPMDLTLNLQFRAITNTQQEVVLPCIELQKMILPSGAASSDTGFKKFGENTFLSPPGPSPFKEFLDVTGQSTGETINVSIGTLIALKQVIVKDVTVEYHNKFHKNGDPIAADVAIHFQTFEIITKEGLVSNAEGSVYGANTTSLDKPKANPDVPLRDQSANFGTFRA